MATHPSRPASFGHVTWCTLANSWMTITVLVDLLWIDLRPLGPDLVLLFTGEGKSDQLPRNRIKDPCITLGRFRLRSLEALNAKWITIRDRPSLRRGSSCPRRLCRRCHRKTLRGRQCVRGGRGHKSCFSTKVGKRTSFEQIGTRHPLSYAIRSRRPGAAYRTAQQRESFSEIVELPFGCVCMCRDVDIVEFACVSSGSWLAVVWTNSTNSITPSHLD